MLKFDFLIYKTLISYIYKKDIKGSSWDFTSYKQMAKLDSRVYERFMEKQFAKAFIQESKKITKTIQSLKDGNYDVIFFQEVSDKFLKALHR